MTLDVALDGNKLFEVLCTLPVLVKYVSTSPGTVATSFLFSEEIDYQ